MSDPIIIGRFASAFGVAGFIKVISYTENPADILKYEPWLVKESNAWQVLKIEEKKILGKHFLVKIANFDTKETVKYFTNCEIAIDKSQLSLLPAGKYYWHELIGLKVYSTHGEEFGVVESIMATGANDVLVVKGERERLIPYLNFVVIEVDLKQKKMLVDWEMS